MPFLPRPRRCGPPNPLWSAATSTPPIPPWISKMPRPTRRPPAFYPRNGLGSIGSWLPAMWIPSACSRRRGDITRGGIIGSRPGIATWGGASTIFSSLRNSSPRSPGPGSMPPLWARIIVRSVWSLIAARVYNGGCEKKSGCLRRPGGDDPLPDPPQRGGRRLTSCGGDFPFFLAGGPGENDSPQAGPEFPGFGVIVNRPWAFRCVFFVARRESVLTVARDSGYTLVLFSTYTHGGNG